MTSHFVIINLETEHSSTMDLIDACSVVMPLLNLAKNIQKNEKILDFSLAKPIKIFDQFSDAEKIILNNYKTMKAIYSGNQGIIEFSVDKNKMSLIKITHLKFSDYSFEQFIKEEKRISPKTLEKFNQLYQLHLNAEPPYRLKLKAKL